jgi:hypothetical protein
MKLVCFCAKKTLLPLLKSVIDWLYKPQPNTSVMKTDHGIEADSKEIEETPCEIKGNS